MSKHAMTNPRNKPVRSGRDAKKNFASAAQIPLAPEPAPAVTSEPNLNEAAGIVPAAQPATPAQPLATPARSMTKMDLTLTRSTAARKNPRLVIYNIEGRTGSVQFLSTLFGGSQKEQGNPPATLTLSGEFAEPKAKVEKIKETPEERKARLAALPKPTLAEKVAAAEKRAQALREKLAKASAAPAA